MVVDGTILNTDDLDHHLGYEEYNSHPIVCQIGGSDPETISRSIAKVISFGYDEININMGCPSHLVGKQNFGAILMKHVEQAQKVVKASNDVIQQFPNIKLSVKCRIGVDEFDSLEYMVNFIQQLKPYCRIFYLHARKCLLGWTTKQNRAVPPLNYPRVFELCQQFPDCDFYINGGIPDLQAAKDLIFGIDDSVDLQLHQVPCEVCQFPNGSCVVPSRKPPPNLKGCLLGRVARDNPCFLWDIDRYFYGEVSNPCQNRLQVINQYLLYLESVVPRRCCDVDPRETRKIPSVSVDTDYTCCPYCVDFYFGDDKRIAPVMDNGNTRPKITTHVFCRALRPLIGIMSGVPNSRKFRKEFDRLIDTEVRYRNCGPSVTILRALQVIERKDLEKKFEKIEDMQLPSLSNRYCRSIDCCNGVKRW
jgi:tRNA-dihydrouridine synthase A